MAGYLGGNLVGTASINLPAGSFVWLGTDIGPVDQLVFTSSSEGTWWLVDSFTYNGSVPEAASLLLCVAGLALAALRKLRRP